MNIENKRVVILGGTSGIGLATAQAAAGAGAHVTVVSSNQTSVDRALAALPAGTAGRAVHLTDRTQIDRLFEDLGDIDHMAFTAGEALALMTLAALDLQRAKDFFDLRYFGSLYAAHAAAPHLRPGGSITLTMGTAAYRPDPGWSVAASITGAIEALTRALAVELAPDIRVNAVAPGVVRSPLWASLSDADREQLYRETAKTVPLQRIGEPEDVAHAFLYCMSGPFVTGTILTVDGGSVLA